MKQTLLILLFATLLNATNSYEGCGINRDDALSNLSSNIKSRVGVSTTIEESSLNNESIESKISSYINTSTNLTLVKIDYKTKSENMICAIVQHKDQQIHTRKLLDKALQYNINNLPKDIDEKIKKLTIWIDDIEQLSFLMSTFLEDIDKEQQTIDKKEKIFKDLYSEAIEQSNSLVWRSCANTKDDAKVGLNKLLFINKGVEEKKSFWSSITSIFTNSEKSDIDYFDSHISYTNKNNKECATIKKDQLFKVASKMNTEVKRFDKKSLDENPKKRYDQIEEYNKQFMLTEKLISLYPDTFKSSDFSTIKNLYELLARSKKKTFPQYVIFNIRSESKVKIKIDDIFIENNTKHYLDTGEHNYVINTKDRCPIIGSFSNSLKEDETISEDFDDYKYPIVTFITNNNKLIDISKPKVFLDGNDFPVNKSTPIKKCSDEPIRYIATYSEQSSSGEVSLKPTSINTIELNFLTSSELAVFNDAKSKNFTTTTGTKFSESLTPVSSKNLVFSIEDDAEHGEVELHEGGNFKYISKEGFVGVDSFEYSIKAYDDESAPKVVNITVNKSYAPVATVVPTEEKKITKAKPKEEIKKEEVKKNDTIKNKTINKDNIDEKKYQVFKDFVNSRKQTKETLQELQKAEPLMFKRLLEEMTAR